MFNFVCVSIYWFFLFYHFFINSPSFQVFGIMFLTKVSNYGSGERVGRCLPVGSFLCMAGGRDRSGFDISRTITNSRNLF